MSPGDRRGRRTHADFGALLARLFSRLREAFHGTPVGSGTSCFRQCAARRAERLPGSFVLFSVGSKCASFLRRYAPHNSRLGKNEASTQRISSMFTRTVGLPLGKLVYPKTCHGSSPRSGKQLSTEKVYAFTRVGEEWWGENFLLASGHSTESASERSWG